MIMSEHSAYNAGEYNEERLDPRLAYAQARAESPAEPHCFDWCETPPSRPGLYWAVVAGLDTVEAVWAFWEPNPPPAPYAQRQLVFVIVGLPAVGTQPVNRWSYWMST